jgi:hypothetical protein
MHACTQLGLKTIAAFAPGNWARVTIETMPLALQILQPDFHWMVVVFGAITMNTAGVWLAGCLANPNNQPNSII